MSSMQGGVAKAREAPPRDPSLTSRPEQLTGTMPPATMSPDTTPADATPADTMPADAAPAEAMSQPGVDEPPMAQPAMSEALSQSTIEAASGPTDREIARRAYELYLARGGAHGFDMDDWIEAESELRAVPSDQSRERT